MSAAEPWHEQLRTVVSMDDKPVDVWVEPHGHGGVVIGHGDCTVRLSYHEARSLAAVIAELNKSRAELRAESKG